MSLTRKAGEVGMTIQRMVELLEIEHKCMLKGSHDDCDRNCADCELVQDDNELHEMYTNVIAMLKEQEAKKVLQIRNVAYRTIGYCPSCGRWLDSYEDGNSGDHITNYCYNCGQAVKWE